ncbi:alpha/beta hydrolase [Sphingobium sp.]|uniref:alpha/beta hydrolase n=1 Tax=Sphingobium sp. TaxID=1912891 RepID=UPI0028BD3C61|nr:alpha/beta hydrolase [Sphingobium sp.]
MTGATFDEATIEAELRRIGARFDPQVLAETRQLYRSAAAALPWAGRPVVEDLAYGPATRNRIDVYPADAANAPVMLFLHGGGFVGGDKRGDPLFYGNVGRYFAAHGYLTILANYRLAPDSTWPSGNEDVAAILSWIDRNAAEHGGDARRIVIIGQSAGAAHVAGYLFDPRWKGYANPSIRAAALLSGFYRAKEPIYEGPRLYLGDDAANWADRSPATHVGPDHPPLLLSIAELDPAQIADQTFDLATALNAADGRPPELCWFAGHNHVSTVHGLGLGRDSVGRKLREFAAGHVS